MKSFVVKLENMSLDEAFDKMTRAADTGIPYQKENELICGNIQSVFSAFPRAQIELFNALLEHKPENLTELAAILEKDIGNVSRDAASLEMKGLIELRKDSQDPRALKPIALYDGIIFDFHPTPRKSKGA